MLMARTSRPATYGARPPPMNRTNEYAAEATGRSTGETVMTACVVTVLFTPQKMPERITRMISTGLSSVQIAMPSVSSAKTDEVEVHRLGDAEPGLQPRRAEHGEQRDEDAPAEEHQAQLDRRQLHRERRVAQDREEAPVVAQRGERHGEQPAVPQRLERRGEARRVRGLRCLLDEYHGGDQRDRHQHGHAVERAAPGDLAERAADERADRDAEAERGLVEHDRAREPAASRSDDDRERGGDEQCVPDAPASAEPDDLADRAGRPGQCGERHDQDEPGRSASTWRRSGWTPSW